LREEVLESIDHYILRRTDPDRADYSGHLWIFV
jgi:hypothetical protein